MEVPGLKLLASLPACPPVEYELSKSSDLVVAKLVTLTVMPVRWLLAVGSFELASTPLQACELRVPPNCLARRLPLGCMAEAALGCRCSRMTSYL